MLSPRPYPCPAPQNEMSKKSIEDLSAEELDGRRVLVRVDYNVPLDGEGRVADDTRIRATLATLGRLRSAGARVVILAHFGRPGGMADPALSLRPAAQRLGELLGAPVDFCEDTVGPDVAARI